MPSFQDLSGLIFGNWTVIKRVPDYVTPGGNHFTQYECQCACGTTKNVLANALRSGRSRSCGCVEKDVARQTAKQNFTTHGDSKTRLYKIWAYMIKRCENPNASNYKNYGERGITVCDAWHDYLEFKTWAIANGYNDNLSIDRRNVNGGYNPDNCRWTDTMTQANNRRSSVCVEYDHEEHTLAEWSRMLNIPYKRLYKQFHNKGLSLAEIVFINQSNI